MTTLTPEQDAAWRERMARYDEIQANLELKLLDAVRRPHGSAWAPWQIVLTVFGGGTALFVAGALLAKLLEA